MNPIFLEYSILFLQRATSYDGGDDEGGSIVGLVESIDKIWWPLVGIVLLFLAVKSIFTNIFSDKPRDSETKRDFNSEFPTIQDKQNYYDHDFWKEKLKIEREWDKQRKEFLNREGEYKSLSFDITNKSHYSKRISRKVVIPDNSSDKGFKLLTEYWTYDGQWRQGYWDGKYDYSDENWDKNTKCDFLDLTRGDIQPKVSLDNSSNSNNHPNSPINKTIEFNQNYEGDDLPF
jgi:hypothetical protein